MTTDIFPPEVKKYTHILFKPTVLAGLFVLFIIAYAYVTILNTSYGEDMAEPFGLVKMPAVYVDIIDDSIDTHMTAALPPTEDVVANVPLPQKKPVR